MRRSAVWTASAIALLLAMVASPALTQESALSARSLEEIIVTAHKWEQSASTVGMSITAAAGDVLFERGIKSVADLTRLVPGSRSRKARSTPRRSRFAVSASSTATSRHRQQ
jgi:outer membrane cobalamin receptor